jgi:acetyl-CoA carboxylase carboxyltransferase component
VPKISVVLRKSYGAGYFVMNGLAYEADFIVAWPTAEIAVMGPDGAVNIIHRRTLAAIEDDAERSVKRLELAEEIRANIDPYIAAGHAQLDDIIDPAETRAAIARGLRITADKRVDRPWRKHGVLPV